MEYASKAVGNAALTTGIIGTSLGALSSAGGLANVLGIGTGNKTNSTDPGDRPVTRHEMELYQTINSKDNQITLLTANQYVDRNNAAIQQQLSGQAVWNATQQGALAMQADQINQLRSMTRVMIPNESLAPGYGPARVTPMFYPPYPVPSYLLPPTPEVANTAGAATTNTTNNG